MWSINRGPSFQQSFQQVFLPESDIMFHGKAGSLRASPFKRKVLILSPRHKFNAVRRSSFAPSHPPFLEMVQLPLRAT